MSDGRKYYYNPDSGERTWTNPYYGNTDAFMNSNSGNSNNKYNNEKGTYNHPSNAPSLNPMASNLSSNISSQSLSENARVFLQLLKDKSIPFDLPWEKVLKEIMSYSEYRAVHTVQERKAIWELYVNELKLKSAMQRQEVVHELKERLFILLDEYEGIERMPCAVLKESIGMLEVFEELRMALTDKEMRDSIDEYLGTFKERQERKYNEERKEAKEYVKTKLRESNLNAASKWLDFKNNLIYDDPTINLYLKREVLSPKDLLYAFEDQLGEILPDTTEAKDISSNVKSPSHLPNTGGNILDGLMEELRKSLFNLVGLEKCWPSVWESLLKSESGLIDSILKNLSFPVPILDVYWQVLDSNRRLYEREVPLINEVLKKRPFMQRRIEEFIDHIRRRREDVSTFSCRIYFQKYFYEPSSTSSLRRPAQKPERPDRYYSQRKRGEIRKNEEAKMPSEPKTEASVETPVKSMSELLLSGNIVAPKDSSNETAPSYTIIDGEAKRLIEMYKYSLKHHYDPPIQLGSEWDDFAEMITSSQDYLSLPDKSLGKYYFDKYQKYLAKKNINQLPSDDAKVDEPMRGNADDMEEGELAS